MTLEAPLHAKTDEAVKAFQRHLARSEQQQRLAAAVALAAVDARIVASVDAFDRDPWLLNVANGTLELRTGDLRPHRREDLLSKLAPVEFDRAAEAPTWMRFLDRIFNSDQELIAFVQRALGYSLTGLTIEQVLFLLHGSGANGKSTLLETFRRLLGDYAQQAPAETFLEQRAGGIRSDLARLPGARLVSAVETGEGRRLDEALVKQLTGGDTIAARRLYREFFEFRPVFKLWIATNHLPEVRGADEAIWRRIRLVPFNVTIPESERDSRLDEKLAREASGILRWLVDGCQAWRQQGLGVTECVAAATAGYRSTMDVLGCFIEERCVQRPDATVKTSELYTLYTYWADAHGEEKLTQKAFGLRLRERGFQPGRTNGTRFYRGLGVAQEGDA
jgi:putative DNA primase/helicase